MDFQAIFLRYALILLKPIKSIDLPGGMTIAPTYLHAGAIVFLIFLLILTLGQVRHRMINWELKGIIPGIMVGFVLAFILEGFLLISGKTLLAEVFGWKSPPKPLANFIDVGREQLVSVLGVQIEVDESKGMEYVNSVVCEE